VAASRRLVVAAGLALFTVLLAGALVRYESLKAEHPEAAQGFTMLQVASVLVYLVGVGLLVYLTRKK